MTGVHDWGSNDPHNLAEFVDIQDLARCGSSSPPRINSHPSRHFAEQSTRNFDMKERSNDNNIHVEGLDIILYVRSTITQ
jgi:hypothetical protein